MFVILLTWSQIHPHFYYSKIHKCARNWTDMEYDHSNAEKNFFITPKIDPNHIWLAVTFRLHFFPLMTFGNSWQLLVPLLFFRSTTLQIFLMSFLWHMQPWKSYANWSHRVENNDNIIVPYLTMKGPVISKIWYSNT